MLGTKPERQSPHLAPALALAARLDRLRQGGASFPYPQSNDSPFYWACLEASADGRARADEASQKRADEKRERDEQRRLDEWKNRGGGR